MISKAGVAMTVIPVAYFAQRIFLTGLGADPLIQLIIELGYCALIFLALCLSVTPLRLLSGWSWLVVYRRPLGLACFAYATLHLSAALLFLYGGSFEWLLEQLTERPYAVVGSLAWLLLLPLAWTSTRKARRKMGKRWLKLHKLVYVVAVLALVHLTWIQKTSYAMPALFLLVFGLGAVIRISKTKRKSARLADK